MIMIVEANDKNLDKLTDLAMHLWPDNQRDSLKEDFNKVKELENHKLYLAIKNDEYVGFIHLSLRTDYVEGSNSSPVGYVEGIYVEPGYRNLGISRELIKHGEKWAMTKGCTQMASDIEMDNKDSYAFHLKVGFLEAGRIIAFIKDLNQN